MLIHIFFIFVAPFLYDESFYAVVPYRLINGDSLIQHEWNLTQFSSLFQYLPVYIWTALKGSAEGVIFFLRCVYLVIHTTVAVATYRFFREHGMWAILAAIMFYVQVPYGLLAISYHSMLVIFALLLSFCLISIYQKQSVRCYIFAGICFGCLCVCNPILCFVAPLYLLSCILWTKRQVLMKKILYIRVSRVSKKGEKLTKKQKKQQNQNALCKFTDLEKYNCFFTKKAIIHFAYGLCIVAVIAIIFFFFTGGTISSVIRNTENLLSSSEYDIASQSIFSKLTETLGYFSESNLNMPWILPLLFVVMLFDKKKHCNLHRFVYLSVALIWSIIFIYAVVTKGELNAFSLPFFVISTVCYLLTKNKNKMLFYCMGLPCLVITAFQYIAANTHMAAIGVVLAVYDVAGIFFARDLWKEMYSCQEPDNDTKIDRKYTGLCRSVIIITVCVQIVFYVMFYQSGKVPGIDAVKATSGPYAGLYMTEDQSAEYNKVIDDIDSIKMLTKKDDPVLIISFKNWTYLYLDRPFATYTTWYEGALNINPKQLIRYYKENSDRAPKYIYIEASDTDKSTVPFVTDKLSEVFELSEGKRLSNGVLFSVEYLNF